MSSRPSRSSGSSDSARRSTGSPRAEPALAQLVDLHFFCGFSFTELAELQGVSDRTIRRHWRNARLLLHRAMQDL